VFFRGSPRKRPHVSSGEEDEDEDDFYAPIKGQRKVKELSFLALSNEEEIK